MMAMKKLSILILLQIMLLPLQAQENRRLRFQVVGIDSTVMRSKMVYYIHMDTIFDRQETDHDGHVFFSIPEMEDYEEDYVVIRQDENSIAKIKLKCFLDTSYWIKLPKTKIRLFSNCSCKCSENSEIALLPHNDSYDNKKCYSNGYSYDELKMHFGYVDWYFPTELFIQPQIQYNKIIHDSLYCCRMSKTLGHYPTNRDIDSLANLISAYNAEHFVGFYSFVLMKFHEPVLWEKSEAEKDVFRYSWISEDLFYSYEPYTIRIEHYNDWSVVYLSYQKRNDCDEEELIFEVIPIKDSDFQCFLMLLKSTDFNNSPTIREGEGLFDVLKTNILEANVDGQYHVIFRGEGEDPALDELRKFLWSLTGLGENKIVHKRQRIE